MSETIDVRVMCFANGGENFDSSSCNTYVLDGAVKYDIFKKYFTSLLAEKYQAAEPSNELVKVRVVLYAAGTAGTDDWNVWNFTLNKASFKQLERNLVVGLLELGAFDKTELAGIAVGKKPEKRVTRDFSKKTDIGSVKEEKSSTPKRRGFIIEDSE